VVHAGVAVLLTGVAASSTFQHVRDVRLSPGQTAHVGSYDVRYVRPTSRMQAEKVSLGAVLDVSKGGHHVATLQPTRGYYPTLDPSLGPVGRYFDGDATSEVGLKAGPTRDIWTAVEPDLNRFQGAIARADREFADATPATNGLLLSAIAARYEAAPPPATFRMIVSPLVEWVWLGGGIAALGGLLALWPTRVRRRAVSRAAARVRLWPRRALEGA
jgi:cytochrome c-type biogenesis protein CcmF